MRRQTSRSIRPIRRPTRAASIFPLADGPSAKFIPEIIARPRRAAIRRRLLSWYDCNKRDLPWRRRSHDPYAQWVAEIMLQQTRVETVLDFYQRFLTAFPTIRALADADHQRVLKHWEGLGYYRRILHFHRAARTIRDSGGRIPRTSSELRSLSGIGEYTAAAIASIAFGESVAAVDGNVARVIARLFAIEQDTRIAATKRRIQRLADDLLAPTRPGDFNQAWMDLGSSVCTPKSPRCPTCPLRSLCRANAAGVTGEVPISSARTRPVDQAHVVVLAIRDRKLLMRRRPEGGLWSGLWEFPTTESNGSLLRSRERILADPKAVGGKRGGRTDLQLVDSVLSDESLSRDSAPRSVGVVDHQLTHRSLTFHVYAIDVRAPMRKCLPENRRWVSKRMFEKLPVSTAHRRIHAAFTELLATGASPVGVED